MNATTHKHIEVAKEAIKNNDYEAASVALDNANFCDTCGGNGYVTDISDDMEFEQDVSCPDCGGDGNDHTRSNSNTPVVPEAPEAPYDEHPEQCWYCEEVQNEGEEGSSQVIDADPGDCEVGPQPDICEVWLCDKCTKLSQKERVAVQQRAADQHRQY